MGFFQVEERTQCMQSGKVRYNNREDTLLSLSIPMDAVLNKGERICWVGEPSMELKERVLPPQAPFSPIALCLVPGASLNGLCVWQKLGLKRQFFIILSCSLYLLF